MNKHNSVFMTTMLALGISCLSGPVSAGQWKPLCVEGSSCSSPYKVHLGGGPGGYRPIDPYAAGPLVTSEGILLHHTPVNPSPPCLYCAKRPDIFQLSPSDSEDLGGGFGFVSDVNSTQLPDGRKLAFRLEKVAAWYEPEDGIEITNWSGQSTVGLNNAAFTGPPVSIGDAVYVGIRGGGGTNMYVSYDKGNSWSRNFGSNIRIGDDRFNLVENPEKDALWAINSEFSEDPGSLWELADHGEIWVQVDDGSFPPDTVRIVHDPASSLVSYALSSHGLFVSVNQGISWQNTTLTEAVHGLVFVDRIEPLSRAFVVGTDSGVKVSVDEAVSWIDMSSGLLAQPYTVTYGHGQLIATGDSGYFTCNTVDCAGLAQSQPPEEDLGIVEVIEFYHSDLDHYFITASETEVTAIEQGLAGKGWVRTGEKFLAWSLASGNPEVTDVCRFYGSMHPGPNSHFYSVSPSECRFLMDLQELIPADRPRWNFEGYAFSMLPSAQDDLQPCPDNSTPVYRVYNNGFIRGEDSNHRYFMDLNLLNPMLDEGWVDEGVAFCSPDS